MEKVSGPTLDDFIEEGRAMESVIRSSADFNDSEHKAAREAASECRELALESLQLRSRTYLISLRRCLLTPS
jgi:hypothetical protein